MVAFVQHNLVVKGEKVIDSAAYSDFFSNQGLAARVTVMHGLNKKFLIYCKKVYLLYIIICELSS